MAVRGLIVLLLLAATVGVQARPGPAWYVVRSGDHLTGIAQRLDTTVDAIKRANTLRGDVIHPGQRLDIPEPFARSRADAIRWQTPIRSRGKLVRGFGAYEVDRIIMPHTGVKLACPVGHEVRVPAHGVLRFLAALEDLGTIAIIDHGAGRHTVLGPLDPDSVPWQPGQAVVRGDVLGVTAPPPVQDLEPYLHLEYRVDSRAVPPTPLLP